MLLGCRLVSSSGACVVLLRDNMGKMAAAWGGPSRHQTMTGAMTAEKRTGLCENTTTVHVMRSKSSEQRE